MITGNIARCVIHPQHCRLGLLQDSDFAGDLEDSKLTSSESYVPLEVDHLLSQVGYAGSKRQCLTVPQNRKLFLQMRVRECTDSSLLK